MQDKIIALDKHVTNLANKCKMGNGYAVRKQKSRYNNLLHKWLFDTANIKPSK